MRIHLPPVRKPRIEMIPLIDIVFLLLVVFVYAMLSMAVHRSLPVRLPASQSIEVAQEKAVLAITVQQGAGDTVRIFVDRDEVADERLVDELRLRAAAIRQQANLEPTAQLFADNSISFQRLFRVLDRVRQAGLGQVSLQAEQER